MFGNFTVLLKLNILPHSFYFFCFIVLGLGIELLLIVKSGNMKFAMVWKCFAIHFCLFFFAHETISVVSLFIIVIAASI